MFVKPCRFDFCVLFANSVIVKMSRMSRSFASVFDCVQRLFSVQIVHGEVAVEAGQWCTLFILFIIENLSISSINVIHLINSFSCCFKRFSTFSCHFFAIETNNNWFFFISLVICVCVRFSCFSFFFVFLFVSMKFY